MNYKKFETNNYLSFELKVDPKPNFQVPFLLFLFI
jgi:hypothetical protein